MSIKALQEYTRISKYARYNPIEKRRETWEEQVNRVFDMHLKKFGDKIDSIKEDIDFSRDMMTKKRILGSQRALQFGGDPVLKKNNRIYNCTASYCDRPRFFQECMFLLLCGCGAGFSVQKHHIDKLPNIKEPYKGKKTFVCSDDIEGWSDCIGVLMSSYFNSDNLPFPEYRGYDVEFDLSKIRPAGSLISSGCKAPGPKPLEDAINKIKHLLSKTLKQRDRLNPIDAYDIVMFSSDAVLSGGIRRSACLCLFSLDDEEMMKAKTGSWRRDNPQRGRSNNSVLLLREKTPKDQFLDIIKNVKEYGEPGFVWSDDKEFLVNPCVTEDTWVNTINGSKQVKDLIGKKEKVIVDGKDYEMISDGFFCTGDKEVFKITTKEGYEVKATENHLFKDDENNWKELKYFKNSDKIRLNKSENISWEGDGTEKEGWLLGSLLGDANDSLVYNNNKKSILKDIFNDCKEENLEKNMFNIIEKASHNFYIGFLKGCFANGKYINNRDIENEWILDDFSMIYLKLIQRMLLRLGIYSKILQDSVNKLIISGDSAISLTNYLEGVNFENKIKPNKTNYFATIEKIESVGVKKVYDCTVEDIHAFDANGFYAHNCCEIGMLAKIFITPENKERFKEEIKIQGNEKELSGWQNCNLCEINVKKAKTEEDFLEACRAAAILGTLQAAYNNFDYLGEVSEEICKSENLLGISMTGMADNPEIAFNKNLQRKGAKLILEVNEKIAKAIGIGPCARSTCVKPAGSSSCVLGTASGIHPHHAKRYFRRVQANKLEIPLQYFKKYNPLAVEQSVWNSKDEIIIFLCEVPDGAKTKNQVDALTLLENVKLTQQNWVEAGIVRERGLAPWLKHNVSNTINVKPDEWHDVANYIYKNKEYFTGISMLPVSGDKDYPQAPFTAVYTPTEVVRKYGDGSLMASGLIVDGLRAFNNNLWEACDCAMDIGEILDYKRLRAKITEDCKLNGKIWKKEGLSEETPDKLLKAWLKSEVRNYQEKIDWVRRAKQFAKRYFNDDIRSMTYCLKDVYNWKLWCDLSREYVEIDWSNCFEDKDGNLTFGQAGGACAGGSCELGDLGLLIKEKKTS